MITVVPATIEHAERMAPVMRREDSTEILALGYSPIQALRAALKESAVAETAILGDSIVALWGATPQTQLGHKALMWMLGTDLVPKHPRELLRGSKSFIDHVHRTYPLLECLVDTRYTKAVRWIHWMGFQTCFEFPINGVQFALCQKEA
jgi:hypothetical protein